MNDDIQSPTSGRVKKYFKQKHIANIYVTICSIYRVKNICTFHAHQTGMKLSVLAMGSTGKLIESNNILTSSHPYQMTFMSNG